LFFVLSSDENMFYRRLILNAHLRLYFIFTSFLLEIN